MRCFVARRIMHPLSPKIRFVSTLIAMAMVWSFAVPVVHLVCGMATDDVAILCEVEEGSAARMSGHAAPHHTDAHGSMASHATDAHGSMNADSDRITECCVVDAAAADRNAFLPSLSQLPTPAVGTLDAPLPDVSSDAPTADRNLVDDTSPPVAFRLLFSVFLI